MLDILRLLAKGPDAAAEAGERLLPALPRKLWNRGSLRTVSAPIGCPISVSAAASFCMLFDTQIRVYLRQFRSHPGNLGFGEKAMIESRSDRFFPLVFRLLMAWTFLYAASSQVLNPMFSFAGLLRNTKTFHNFFAVFATAEMIPVITFLVAWGHLLIGLSPIGWR